MLRLGALRGCFTSLQAVRPVAKAGRAGTSGVLSEPRSYAMSAIDEVQADVSSGVAVVTLNRPKALNSLHSPMVEELFRLYSAWDKPDSSVACVVVKGTGGKAFCAGGDVKQLVLDGRAGNFRSGAEFFWTEYRLNYLIAHFSKPYVALVDGIVMGGGAGLSMHGDFRVATERTLFAMPECGIGLFPDVGAAFFLQARAPPPAGRALALWLGVTGARLSGAELKQAGLATHCVHSSQLPQLEEQIKGLGAKASDRSVLNALLCDAEAAAPCGAASALADKLPVLERCFSQGSLLDVKKALEREAAGGSAFAADVLSDMRKKSPLSMAVAFELFKRAQGAPLGAVLQLDYLLAQHFSHDRGDFFEGVRATLIDKGSSPQWKYPDIESVPADVVRSFFDYLPGYRQLELPAVAAAKAAAAAARPGSGSSSKL